MDGARGRGQRGTTRTFVGAQAPWVWTQLASELVEVLELLVDVTQQEFVFPARF